MAEVQNAFVIIQEIFDLFTIVILSFIISRENWEQGSFIKRMILPCVYFQNEYQVWLPGNRERSHEEINYEPYMNELSNLTFSVPENQLFLELNLSKTTQDPGFEDITECSDIYVINPVKDYSKDSIREFSIQQAQICDRQSYQFSGLRTVVNQV